MQWNGQWAGNNVSLICLNFSTSEAWTRTHLQTLEPKNLFFDSEELDDSSDDDSLDDDSSDDESTDELFILPNQERLGRKKVKGIESVFKSFDKINIENRNDSDGESECKSDQECSDIYSNEDEEAYVCGSDDDSNDLEDFDNDSDMFESDSDNDYYDSGSD